MGGYPLVEPKLRVLCFHGAGSTESIYTCPGTPFIAWVKERKDVEICAFDYPGRNRLVKARKQTTTHALARDLLATIHQKLTDGVPYIVWAHSVGTWVAFDFLVYAR